MDPGYTRAMQPGLVRPTLLSVLLIGLIGLSPGCGEKGGTTDTAGETGEASTGGVGGTTTTGASSEPTTTGGVATVTSETHETHTTQAPECGDSGCGACQEGCVANDQCVDGEWQCGCDCDESTGAGSTGSESTGDPNAIMCGGEDPQFPEFDRTCAVVRDCTVVFHQIDCCGTLVAWGLSGAAGKPFNEAETECVAQYPACDCAPMPTTADDGKSTEDPTQIMVGCIDGMCSSFVP